MAPSRTRPHRASCRCRPPIRDILRAVRRPRHIAALLALAGAAAVVAAVPAGGALLVRGAPARNGAVSAHPHGAPSTGRARGGGADAVTSTTVTTSATVSTANGGTPTTSTATTTTTTTTTVTTESGGPPNPCAPRRRGLLCPNIVMSAPSELHLDRTTIRGRVLLRATSSVNSLGAGPLELRARRSARRAWTVYQAIYDRRGHPHLFRTRVHLVYKYIPGYRYEYGNVGAASYWKVRHVAAFQLWSIDPHRHLLRLVRTGPKVDYCLRDLLRTHLIRRSPAAAVYPACNQRASILSDRLGTSVGWSDVYPYSYPEQWIDVTGLRGRFAFVQIANPRSLWYETSTRDNASETFVSLPSGRILGSRVGVPAP
jgi:hypothetical protein